MRPDPPAADYAVMRVGAGGAATIYACRAHLAFTKSVLQAGDPAASITVGPANVDNDGVRLQQPVHGCKGHLDGWPVMAG